MCHFPDLTYVLIVSIPKHAHDYYIELNILVNEGINVIQENTYKHPFLITGHVVKFVEYYFISLS